MSKRPANLTSSKQSRELSTQIIGVLKSEVFKPLISHPALYSSVPQAFTVRNYKEHYDALKEINY